MAPVDVAVFAAKLVFGTLAFLLIGTIGASNDKGIAGAMLTFPVLNGIGLLTSPDKDLHAVVGVMMPLIVLNGCLCFAFIAAFRWTKSRAGHIGIPALSYGLGIVGGLIWCGFALWLIPALAPLLPSPFWIAAIYVLASVIATLLYWSPATASSGAPRLPFLALWWQRRWRVAFFVASLFVLLVAAGIGNATWVGRLSALPLVPLCVIAGLAIDDGASLPSIKDSVLLGPGLAMLFAPALVLPLTPLQQIGGATYWTLGSLALALGWLICIAAIHFGVPPLAAALDRSRA